jgi:hypothetical protein
MFLNRLINILLLFCLLHLLLNGRVFTDGPFSFAVPTLSTVDVVQPFFEITGKVDAQYLIQLSNKPSPINLSLRSINNFPNLKSTAAHRQKSWANSEIGDILLAEKFNSTLGYPGISQMRQTPGNSRQGLEDYSIILDLSHNDTNSTLEWKNDSNESHWLKVELSAISENSEDSTFEVALAIAGTVTFEQADSEETITFSELSIQSEDHNISLNSTFSDGPLSFSAPENSLVDHVFSYKENSTLTRAIYALESRDYDLPFNISIETESTLASPEKVAFFKKRAFERSEIGTLIQAEKISTASGLPGVILTRSYEIEKEGEFFDYWIILDISTREWLDRSNSINTSPLTPWLKATFSGVLADESSYKAAESMAKTLDFNTSFIPQAQSFSNGPSIELNSSKSSRRTVSDGLLSYEVNNLARIDIVSAYHEPNSFPQASYLIRSEGEDFPFALSLSTEFDFPSLEDWAAHQKNTWNNSEVGALLAADSFSTSLGDSGIFILRKTISGTLEETTEFVINIDLSTETWTSGFNQTDQLPWLRAQLVGYFDSLENSNFFDALKIAKSLRFEDINFTENFTFEIFSSAFSPSTQIPVRVISDNWFESTWLGTFYDYQNNWVYHPKLGWIYSIPSSLEGIWIWSQSAEWLWGNSLTFPYLFSEKSRDWIFLNSENKAGALAYDFDQKTWSNWSTLNLKQRKFSPAEQRVEIDRMYYSDKPYGLKIRKISEIIYNGSP